LKELGDHQDGGGKIVVRDGKYGPYVNFGKVNATLPKGKDPQSVTVEDALALIAEKEAKGGGGKKPFRKAAAAKAPTAKKTTTKKAAAKKPAAKKKG
ncbi:DNA topoisomerase I, partial [Mesorhizobium sp. M8A.F.Ca.ET.023.01.1.1]